MAKHRRSKKPVATSGSWDVVLMETDRTAKGWIHSDLADEANLSISTVTRFVKGEVQSPRVAKKLAIALGFPLDRYHRPPPNQPQQPVKDATPGRSQASDESVVSSR
jgi:transcriptional regulator with XRE-family HTH domain